MKTFTRHLRTRAGSPLRSRTFTPRTTPTTPTSTSTSPLHLPEANAKADAAPRPPIRRTAWPLPTYTAPAAIRLAEKLYSGPKGKENETESTPRFKLSDLVPERITQYAYRWETVAPSEAQLQRADTFFLKYQPQYLWSQAKFKKIEFGSVPEVAFIGRSNVGKSSLLNALLNNKGLAYTSSKPGRTRLMNAFSIADGRMVLLDMPGYGHASRGEWGIQIMKYLKSRKQFRRAFLLIDAKHGLKKNDLDLMEQFGVEGVSFQIVLSKIDRANPEMAANLFEQVRMRMESGVAGRNTGLGEILATSAAPARKGEKRVGMSELRWAIMVACGLENVALGGGPRGSRIAIEEQLDNQIEGEY